MSDLIANIFDLAISPFTSNSLLVSIPAGFAFIYGCVCLVFHLMRRA